MAKRSFLWWMALPLALTACGHMPAVNQSPVATQALVALHRATDSGAAYAVTNTVNATKWAKIERLTSTYSAFPTERARPNGRQTDAEIVAAFGTATPPSHDVLLHYGKGWDTGTGVPIVLVHGAILDATANFVEPHGKEGLAPALSKAGRRVFAVTFAHRHGDNMLQAEQLANAIARVRAVTGSTQVDVVAHSKGTVVARALASGVKQPWMRGYAHDVRRLVLIAGPNLGLDYTYRHPSVNYGLFPEHASETLYDAPMCWSKMLVMGVWMDTSAQNLDEAGGGFFPGQAQMLARFDKTYPLPNNEQDYYTTYNGGQGFASFSKGIDHAIATGGNFIERLRQNPLDPAIGLAVLAGNKTDLLPALNETTGPSDSLVFVSSATATDDMTRNGAKLLAKSVLGFNHMNLVIDPEAHAWVEKVLAQP
jgi:triacylglycerol lipase